MLNNGIWEEKAVLAKCLVLANLDLIQPYTSRCHGEYGARESTNKGPPPQEITHTSRAFASFGRLAYSSSQPDKLPQKGREVCKLAGF